MQSAYRTRKETMGINKENLELPSQIPKLKFTVCKDESSLASTRLRKNSDSTDDRMPLQASTINTQNITTRRRRIHSASEANAAKSFANSRFAIYNEDKSKNTKQPTGKFFTSKSTEAVKPLTSIYHAKCVPKTLNVEQQREDDEKSSGQTSDPKKSPDNPLIIPKSDICKIKEKHHKKSAERKKPITVYTLLSVECAYNFEYMPEYINYQMEMIENKKLSSLFLQNGICAEQRKLIVKFFVESATYYKAPSYILYQAVSIFDSYIDKVNVDLQELQITALAALWIALKKDWVVDEIPEATSIMKRAPKHLRSDTELLLKCEKRILTTLQFELGFADPFSMLALYLILVEDVRQVEPSSEIQVLYYYGTYMIDLLMFEKELCNMSALHLAQICAETALVVFMTSPESAANPLWDHWHRRILESNPILMKCTLSEKKRNKIRNQLLQNILFSKDEKTDYHAVYKKYCRKRYGDISVSFTSKICSFYRSKIIDPQYAPRPIIF